MTTRCKHCNGRIIPYYDARYGGERGKCHDCDANFPLE